MHDNVVGGELVDLARVAIGHELKIAMGHHGAFRLAGRSRCVEQPGQIVFIAVGIGVGGSAGFQKGVEVLRPGWRRTDAHEQFHAADLAAHRFDARRKLFGEDDGLGARVSDNVGELLRMRP